MHIGCASCRGAGCDICVGYAPDGTYRLGIVPLALAVAPLFRRRRGALPQQRPSRPRSSPPVHPALVARVLQAVTAEPDISDTDDELGGTVSFYPPANAPQIGAWPFPRLRRLRRQRAQNGMDAVTDADTGEILGFEPPAQTFGADEFGADELGADEFGADDDDDDDDDVLGAADDALGAADQGLAFAGEDVLGAADSKLDRRIRDIKRDIDRLESKALGLRGPFQKARLNSIRKKIEKKKMSLRKLKDRRGDINQARRKAVTAATAAGSGAAAAALLAAGIGGPAVANSRSALNERVPSAYTPQAMADMRRNQTRDGLRFLAGAPPGSGRINPVQFYANVDSPNPRNALTVPVAGITAATTLRTKTLPFVTNTIVGFQASMFGTDSANSAVALVRNLHIQGGTNLFLEEDWVPASQYDVNSNFYSGLRAYPKLQNTNYASVDIGAAGDSSDVVTITCSLLVDVVTDDTYGAGFPGPYAG